MSFVVLSCPFLFLTHFANTATQVLRLPRPAQELIWFPTRPDATERRKKKKEIFFS